MSRESNEELIDCLHRDIERWEEQEIEFMEDYPSNTSELSKEIAAFATKNAGTIYLGVDKYKNIRGVSAIREFGEVRGKDSILDRLAGLTQRAIKPPIIVTTDFIKVEEKIVVVKINVPKGVEPVYFSSDIPYIRNLTSSDRATPDQVKELHRQYFLGHGIFQEINETHNFLTNTLEQLSDFQILWFDYENRDVNPDLDQMKYDIGSTGRALLKLSMDSKAEDLVLSDDLQQLGNLLEEMEYQKFYIDGGKSWESFVDNGDKALNLTNKLLQRVLKRYQLQEGQFDSIKDAIVMNIKELKHCWLRKELYLLAGELSLLKDTLRRLAFNFNRFGNITPQSENFNFKLRQLAKNLREISSDKYFRTNVGHNPLEEIEEKLEENLQISEHILNEIEP
jgi:hypothetical protein